MPIETSTSGTPMALSEIEKLERRYAENPQGLTFAPLAESIARTATWPSALELLGPGLASIPTTSPRASCSAGATSTWATTAAETAFTHVLSLDGENVIALKALADITERLLRFDDAERWLHTLLSIDRSNDEARDQLDRVEVARRQAEAASSGADHVTDADLGAGASEAAASTSMADASPGVSPPPMPELLREGMLGWVAEPGSPIAERPCRSTWRSWRAPRPPERRPRASKSRSR